MKGEPSYTRPDGVVVRSDNSVADIWVLNQPGVRWDFDDSRTTFFHKRGFVVIFFIFSVLLGIIIYVGRASPDNAVMYSIGGLFMLSILAFVATFEQYMKRTQKFRLFVRDSTRLVSKLNALNNRFQPVVKVGKWDSCGIDTWTHTVSAAKLTEMVDNLLTLEAGALLLFEGALGRMPYEFKEMADELKSVLEPFGIKDVSWNHYFKAAAVGVEKASQTHNLLKPKKEAEAKA